MSDISFHDLSSIDAGQRADLLKRAEGDLSTFVEKVRPIIQSVRDEGDAALIRFAREFDKASVAEGELKVSEAEAAMRTPRIRRTENCSADPGC